MLESNTGKNHRLHRFLNIELKSSQLWVGLLTCAWNLPKVGSVSKPLQQLFAWVCPAGLFPL